MFNSNVIALDLLHLERPLLENHLLCQRVVTVNHFVNLLVQIGKDVLDVLTLPDGLLVSLAGDGLEKTTDFYHLLYKLTKQQETYS